MQAYFYKRKALDLVSPSCILQDLQVGVAARGCEVKTNKHVLEVFMLLQNISLSLKFSLQRVKERVRGKMGIESEREREIG